MPLRALDISLTALLASCCLGVFSFGQSANADVRAGGLGTRVNGRFGGSCSAGQCKISGGKDVGINRFHRLSDFDTRGAIRGVSFDTGHKRNLVVGVTSASGSFVDKTVSLSSPAHLFLISPGGISLDTGAGFINTPHLTLSTSNRLHFAGGFLDIHGSSNEQLGQLGTSPLPGAFGLRSFPGMNLDRPPGIQLDGIDIQINKNLLVDAVGGDVQLRNSKILVGQSKGDGGILTLTGKSVLVDGDSHLSTAAAAGGGQIQVGGSWQNTDPTVRQSVETSIGSGVVLDASALKKGDGGEIIVWSDIKNSDSLTIAKGEYLSRGGMDGGNGGRIETSGYRLDVSGIDIDLMPLVDSYSPGEWLIDPYNIEIFTSASNNSGASPNYQSTVSGAILNATDLENALASGNVTVTTGAAGSAGGDAGNIDINASLSISNATNSLTLTAANQINVNSAITRTGGGDIILNAVTIAGTKDINLNGGDLTVNQSGNSTYSGQINKGSGKLIKDGAGVLTLSGANAYLGDTDIRVGTLKVSGSLSDDTNVTVASGATYELAANDSIEGISGAGDVNVSSFNLTVDNTLDQSLSGVLSGTGDFIKQGTGKLELSGSNSISGTIFLYGGTLLISDTTSLGSTTNIEFDGGTLRFGITVSDDSDNTYVLQSGGGTIEVDNSFTLTMNGVISGSGDLTKTGDGTLLLEGINTFTGNAYVNAGTLTVSQASSSPSMANTSCSSGASSNRCDSSVSTGGGGGGGGGGDNCDSACEAAKKAVAEKEAKAAEEAAKQKAADDAAAEALAKKQADEEAEAKQQRELKAFQDQPKQEINSSNSFSLLSGNNVNSDAANYSSTDQVSESQPSSVASGSLSLGGQRSIEGVELSLSESFIVSNEETTVGSPENASSVSTTPGDASEDGNPSGTEASSRSNTEDSSELASQTDQSEDDESRQAKLSSASDTSGASSENINVILVPRGEVESRFALAENKSSQYTSNLLNLSPSGKPLSLRNLQSSLEVMRNIIVNSN